MEINKRIVLIDDDAATNVLNKLIIERSKLVDEVVIFTDATEALDFLIAEKKYQGKNLILVDINMPIMDGWEFVKEYGLRNGTASPKIVMLSSSIDPVDKSRAEAEPTVSEFKSKPLSIDMLSQLVEKYLN